MHCLDTVVLLAALAMGQKPDPPIKPGDAAKYAVAVANGRAEAARELRRGEASIWTYGLNMKLFYESIDRETGLYFSSFGCVIDDEIEGRVEGHNAKIAEHIRAHGPPKNSFKRWEKELFALKDYFEERCLTEKPIRLTAGGRAVSSPDGEYLVRLVKRPDRMNGRPIESVWIVVGEKDIESRRTSLWPKDAEMIWGPKGSWFAIIRGKSRTGDGLDYMALDLKQVRTIRREHGE
jgi:hypothetical protein